MRSSAAVGALLATALVMDARAQLLSPGDLSAAHSSLDGDVKCSECHAEAAKVAAQKCLGCHKELAARVRASAGLHGKTHRGRPCEECHVEHHGRRYRLIRWPGRSMKRFDHNEAGWKLEGEHASLDCAKCHKAKTKSNTRTFLGLASACASCHEDPHKKRFGSKCTDCHNQADWRRPNLDRFDHALARFRLKGKHSDVKCAKCHQDPPRYKGLKFEGCASCHADPHKNRFKQACETCHVETGWKDVSDKFRHPGLSLAAGHRSLACGKCHDRGNTRPPSAGKECRSCHPPVHEAQLGPRCEPCHSSIRWLGLPREIGLAAHEKTPYPLTGRHTGAKCSGCHPKEQPVDARYRSLAFDRCAACHQDAHKGQLAARGDCAACHRTVGFTPTTFGTEAHASARFPLEGRHQAVPCGACHEGTRPRLDFRVTKSACVDCHENPHGNQFATEMARGGCTQCHSPAGWKMPKFEHATWPLTGAHGRTQCARCHGSVGGQGRVDAAAYRGIPRDCEGCHADEHRGQFRLTQPVKACTACHTTERFTIAAFDHQSHSGFAIDGRHQTVACGQCHPTAELASGQTAVRYRLGYGQCRDCHADPHRGVQ